MEDLFIKGTKDVYFKPNVNFNSNSGILEISGESYLEDTRAFYLPLIKWVEQYTKSGIKQVTLNIDLSYYNTSTSKHLLEIFYVLKEFENKGGSVILNWYYCDEDSDVEEEVEDFMLESGLQINLKEKK